MDWGHQRIVSIGKLDFHDALHCCISLFKQHTTIQQVVENEWLMIHIYQQNVPLTVNQGDV